MTPPYEIQSVREVPFATARRTVVAVLVPPGTTPEDAAAIARQVALDRRGVADYNVLQVAFYDRPELIGPDGGPAPLGYWVDAPKGDWGRSLEAKRGLYADFQENALRLRTVDWSKRPSERQATIHEAWFAELRTLRAERDIPTRRARLPSMSTRRRGELRSTSVRTVTRSRQRFSL
ncbi:MAG TPA: hypothetical protein VF640_05780 [Acidimicrobiales bacterium]|jgi:hypothetical protein